MMALQQTVKLSPETLWISKGKCVMNGRTKFVFDTNAVLILNATLLSNDTKLRNTSYHGLSVIGFPS
jgi:hypothetical protein